MIESLLKVLNVLAVWFERYQRERNEKKAQKARNDVESDPNAWFDGHFGGLPPDDAGKANQADIDKKP